MRGSLLHRILKQVPAGWRESVQRDLLEEAARAGRRGIARDLWMTWQALRVAVRFRHQARLAGALNSNRRAIMRDIGSDLRFAWRMLRREPGSSIGIVLTLALGISVTTAVYAVFNFVLFRPVSGVADPDRLVSVYVQENPTTPSRASASIGHLAAMREVSALTGLAAASPADMTFSEDGRTPPRALLVTRVTAGYFQALGVQPRVGRLFVGDEYEQPGPLLTVLSDRLWSRNFAGDPGVVGRHVFINGRPFLVIGVAARFQGPEVVGRDEIWIPFVSRRTLDPKWTPDSDRSAVSSMFGRLAPGATLDVAQAQILAAFRSVGPAIVQSKSFEPVMFAGLQDGIGLTRSRLLHVYRILLTGTFLLLVLACANAANLVLSRHLRRRRDLAVRRAVGASRVRIVRELLVESTILAVVSGAVAMAIAASLLGVFRDLRLLSYLPVLDQLAIDWRVVGFGFLIAAATIIGFALIPALLASRIDPSHALRETTRVTHSRDWFRLVLVSAQLAVSLTLLISAGLLTRTVHNLRTQDLGLDANGVTTFSLAPSRLEYEDAKSAEIFRRTHEQLTLTPGIAAAAVAWQSPLGAGSGRRVRLPDQPAEAELQISGHDIAGDYFGVLGIPLLAGRTFTPADDLAPTPASARPVIVNASLARLLFGDASPLGRSIVISPRTATRQIVGVVGDVHTRDLRKPPVPAIYQPSAFQYRLGTVMLRTTLPTGEAVALAREVVQGVDPALPLGSISTIRDQVNTLISEERVLARLGLVLAALAGLLAGAGLSAVVAFQVRERTREFGIRLALGATPVAVIKDAVARAVRASAIGLAGGAVLALLGSRLIAARLYGVGWIDPVTAGAAVLVLAVLTLVAAWVPARRATTIDPTIALRTD